jgi:hypothetical protein
MGEKRMLLPRRQARGDIHRARRDPREAATSGDRRDRRNAHLAFRIRVGLDARAGA